MSTAGKNLLELRKTSALENETLRGVFRATLLAVEPDGSLRVRSATGAELCCEWLDRGIALDPPLQAGDRVLVALEPSVQVGIVIGRIGPYRAAVVPARVHIEAAETMSLKCGESSIELRADGKLMVKGEDVLVKARGTQRIKAGSVNIN